MKHEPIPGNDTNRITVRPDGLRGGTTSMTNLKKKLAQTTWELKVLMDASSKIKIWTYRDTGDGCVTSKRHVEELQTLVKELKEKYE